VRIAGHLRGEQAPAGSVTSHQNTSSDMQTGAPFDPKANLPVYKLLAKNSKGSLKGKTMFITGASRGIGLAIALRAAQDGANIIIAAKTAEPDPRLPGTIYSAAAEIEKAGGKALPVVCDVRFEEQVIAAVEAGVKKFGGIDICVNNASAISLTGTVETTSKKYDLMHQINTRGTFFTSKACIPYLRKSKNPHILNLSPPLNMEQKWFAPHVAYTMSKYGMSMCALGMAEELRSDGIAANTLWPLTVIATAAVQNVLGGDTLINKSRTAEIMGDAAHAIFMSDSRQVSGNFFVDESVMRSLGVTDFSKYAVVPGTRDDEMYQDFFV